MDSTATLALDTSGAPATVAVAVDSELETPPLERTIEGARPDVARLLVPAIDALLRARGIDRGRVRRILFGAGPGSFTGLRVGAAAARTFAFASGASLVAHASTAGMAWQVFGEHRDLARVAVLLDALRGEFAFALYERCGDAVQAALAPRLAGGAEVRAALGPSTAIASPVPDLVVRTLDIAQPVLPARPSAAALIELDRAGSLPLESTSPLYLRASAAEERARGGNPSGA